MYFQLFFKKIKQILYTQIRTNISKKIKKDATIKLMGKVEFIEQNEFHIKSRKLFGEPTTPTMISFLMKTGLVRNEKQAVSVLLLIVASTLSLTFYLIYHKPQTSDVVVDKYGISYSFDEYIYLVKQGKDPLLPN